MLEGKKYDKRLSYIDITRSSPYVRHPEYEQFLEEKWFYEAVTETYLPLLWTFEKLAEDGVDYRVTINLSPTLISMFNDGLLRQRYVKHLEKLMELADKEVHRTSSQPEFHGTALMYKDLFSRAHYLFTEKYRWNLVEAFRRLQDAGKLEIITTGATHGYFPLLGVQREVINAQVQAAVELYERCFGRKPLGFWLPECGYKPGDDKILKNTESSTLLQRPMAYFMLLLGPSTAITHLFIAHPEWWLSAGMQNHPNRFGVLKKDTRVISITVTFTGISVMIWIFPI